MKRNIPGFLEAAALSMLSAWGSVGCLLSAFCLPVTYPNQVMLVWLCWTLLCAGALLYRWGEAVVLALGAAGAFWLWWEGSFGPQLLSVLGTLAKAYDGGYGTGIPQILRVDRQPADLPLTVLGMLLIFAVCRTVCRRKGNLLPVGLLLLPLAACLVVTDTVPDEGYLFALLFSLCLLLLTEGVRRESGGQAARLCILAAFPVALALGLLLHFCPRGSFVNTTGPLREKLMVSVMELPRKFQGQGLDWLAGFRPKETVELTDLPSQLLLGLPVAEVTAEQSGPIYLRLQDYDVYTGTAWESTPGREDTLAGTGEERGRVNIRTLNLQDSLLLPAFPDGQTFLNGGKTKNENNQLEYTLSLRSASMGAFPSEQWLKLPAETSRRAKELVLGITDEPNTVEQTVAAVAEFVRSSAEYDRGGTAMAGGETDFALWFLEEADRGYCVHFATAAAVLLRSAGIPARYVTGYRIDAAAGEPVKVTSDDAHAWVEYYNYRTWTWNILEATPADLDSPPEETSAPATKPIQAEAQTQPPTAPVSQATQPANAPAPQQVPHKPFQMPVWISLTVFFVSLFCLLAELQRLLRIRLRRYHQAQGDSNRRAAACCREIRLLCRLLKRPLPEEITDLTEKALFSQHTLTREELAVFTGCQTACRRALRKAPWWKKALYRYWFAVI